MGGDDQPTEDLPTAGEVQAGAVAQAFVQGVVVQLHVISCASCCPGAARATPTCYLFLDTAANMPVCFHSAAVVASVPKGCRGL